MLENDVVGLDETAAIAKIQATGTPVRVTRRDTKWFMVTQDHRMDRINLEIDNGKVTRAYRG